MRLISDQNTAVFTANIHYILGSSQSSSCIYSVSTQTTPAPFSLIARKRSSVSLCLKVMNFCLPAALAPRAKVIRASLSRYTGRSGFRRRRSWTRLASVPELTINVFSHFNYTRQLAARIWTQSSPCVVDRLRSCTPNFKGPMHKQQMGSSPSGSPLYMWQASNVGYGNRTYIDGASVQMGLLHLIVPRNPDLRGGKARIRPDRLDINWRRSRPRQSSGRFAPLISNPGQALILRMLTERVSNARALQRAFTLLCRITRIFYLRVTMHSSGDISHRALLMSRSSEQRSPS